MEEKEVMKKKFGKFYIPYNMVNDNIKSVRLIMNRMVYIIHATRVDNILMMEYICQSGIFDEISKDETIPEYIVGIDVEGEVFAERGEIVKKSIIKEENK